MAAVHGRPMRLTERGQQLWAEFDDPDSHIAGCRAAAHRAPGDDDHRLAQPADLSGMRPDATGCSGSCRARISSPSSAGFRAAWPVLHPPHEPPFSETGHWNGTCIACHATHGKPQFDTPFGSAPARHPGRGHDGRRVRHCLRERATGPVAPTWRRIAIRCAVTGCIWPAAPTRPPSSPRISIRDARRRSAASATACGSSTTRTASALANSTGLPYRPGDELSARRFVAQPTVNANSPAMQALLADDSRFMRDSFWSDGMVRVSGREYNGLIESPCFKNAPIRAGRCHASRATRCTRRLTIRAPSSEWADDQLAVGQERQ